MSLKISDIQYFGSVESYLNSKDQTHIGFPGARRYQKALHCNRTWVMGPNNPIGLSIPLEGGRNQMGLVKDVRIDHSVAWARTHWRSIHDAYRKAPWFEEYAPQLEMLFRKREVFLIDFCENTFRWACACLRWEIDILSDVDDLNPVVQRLPVRSVPLLQPPVGYPVYTQVFGERHGFVGNLSILDLILCVGPEASRYVSQLKLFYEKAVFDGI